LNRFVLPLGAFALLAIVLAIGLKNAPEKGVIVSPLIGKPAPAYELPDLLQAGTKLTSQDFLGKWQLLNIWGTWCYACGIEHPVLLQIRQENRVPIVGLDWRDEEPAALDWLAQKGNPYARVGSDREGRVAIAYGAYGAPESFLIDPQGTIVYKHVGPLTMQVWRDKLLPFVIAGKKP
jgi:cytochrome c biogenesis protein CcmG/thiol:disulfide interchange protein DsbE